MDVKSLTIVVRTTNIVKGVVLLLFFFFFLTTDDYVRFEKKNISRSILKNTADFSTLLQNRRIGHDASPHFPLHTTALVTTYAVIPR